MTKEILEALDTGGKDSSFEIRDSRGREDEEERIDAGALAMTEDERFEIGDSRFENCGFAPSGAENGEAASQAGHCEERSDVGPALQGTIRNPLTPSRDEEERIATASVRTGLAMTGDERLESRESRIEEREDEKGFEPDSQNSNLKTQNSSAAALRQRAAAHLDSLYAQAEALREEFPDFDLDAALRDPDFLRLTAPGLGVDLRRAYYALHREDLDSRAARRAAEETRRRLARSLASGGLRPREGGGQEAAAALASDYRSLSRPQQLQLKQRILEAAARGEKIYP